MYLFALVFSGLYICRVWSSAARAYEIRNSIRLISRFIFAYERRPLGASRSGMDYARPKERMMRYYPVISEYVASPSLSYGRPDGGLYEDAGKILNQLKMKSHFARHSLLNSINPLNTFKAVFLIPARAAARLHVRISNSTSTILSVFAGVAAELVRDILLEHLRSVFPVVVTFLQGIH